jgi:hypothetical protein
LDARGRGDVAESAARRWAMAFVCWLALLTPGVGPPVGEIVLDDPSVPDAIRMLTPGSGHEKAYLPPSDCSIPRQPCAELLQCSCGMPLLRCWEKEWRSWLNLVEVANGLWHRLPDEDAAAVGKRIQSILASDRLEHHKREEIVRAIKPGMAVRDVHHVLGSRADNAVVFLEATVYLGLDLVLAHDGVLVREALTVGAWMDRLVEAGELPGGRGRY